MNSSRLTLMARALSIFRTAVICLMIFLAVVVAALLLNPSWLQALLSFSDGTINIEGLTIENAALIGQPDRAISFLSVLALELMAVGGISLYIIDQLSRIIDCVREERPFLPQAVRSLRHLAWISLFMVLLQPGLNGLIQFMFLRQFDFSTILASGIDYSIRFEYVLEINQLIIPLFLFVLCAAFEHGQKLQEFSDSVV